MTESAHHDLKQALLSEVREELAKADAKASILLAASGIAFAALLTAGSTTSWYPGNLADQWARYCAWGAFVLTLVGIVAVGAAVNPRTSHHKPHRPKVRYFGDVADRWPGHWLRRPKGDAVDAARTRFESDLNSMPIEDIDSRIIDQIWVLSDIADRKYRLISRAVQCYGVALAAAIVALVLENTRWV